MYKIRDKQFGSRYFGGNEGAIFKSKIDICEQLISFHEIDCDMSVEKSLLEQGKIEECLKMLKDFEWEIEKIT